MEAAKSISLTELNVAAQCEDGYEFEYLDGNGNRVGAGVFLTVLGAHAPVVQKWANSRLNQFRRQDAMLMKRGKDVVREIEQDIDFGTEFMSIRIVKWRGITEEWSPANALKLCESNPLLIEQVKTASENIANFTRSK